MKIEATWIGEVAQQLADNMHWEDRPWHASLTLGLTTLGADALETVYRLKGADACARFIVRATRNEPVPPAPGGSRTSPDDPAATPGPNPAPARPRATEDPC